VKVKVVVRVSPCGVVNFDSHFPATFASWALATLENMNASANTTTTVNAIFVFNSILLFYSRPPARSCWALRTNWKP
jgi:hypothetical protein